MSQNHGRRILDVKRNRMWWKDSCARRIDIRPAHLTGFYSTTQSNGVVGNRSSIHHGSETGERQHLLQLPSELLGGLLGNIHPLRLHKVDMRVPEAGKDDTAVAGQAGDIFGNPNILTDSSDLPGVNQNRRATDRLRLRRRVD